jgi:hypothetical protein
LVLFFGDISEWINENEWATKHEWMNEQAKEKAPLTSKHNHPLQFNIWKVWPKLVISEEALAKEIYEAMQDEEEGKQATLPFSGTVSPSELLVLLKQSQIEKGRVLGE